MLIATAQSKDSATGSAAIDQEGTMQPNTVLKRADRLNAATTINPHVDEVTWRTVLAAIGAKLCAIFSARHAPEYSSDEAPGEDVLGEQVILPTAFVKEISPVTRKDGRA